MDRRGMQRGGPGGGPRGRGPSRGGLRGRGGPPRGAGPPGGPPRGGPRGAFRGGPPSAGPGEFQKRSSPVPHGQGGGPPHRGGSRRDVPPPFRGPPGRGGPSMGMRGRGGSSDRGGPMGRGGFSDRGAPMSRGGPPRHGGRPLLQLDPYDMGRPDSRGHTPMELDMRRPPGPGHNRGYDDMAPSSYERDFHDNNMGPAAKRGRFKASEPNGRYSANPEYESYGARSYPPREDVRPSGGYVSSFRSDDDYAQRDMRDYHQNPQTYHSQYNPVDDYRNGSRHEDSHADFQVPSYSSTSSSAYAGTAYDDMPSYRRSLPENPASYETYDDYPTPSRSSYSSRDYERANPSSYESYDNYPTPSENSYGSRDYGPPSGSRANNDDHYGYESYGGASSYQSHDNFGSSVSSYGPPQRGPVPMSRRY